MVRRVAFAQAETGRRAARLGALGLLTLALARPSPLAAEATPAGQPPAAVEGVDASLSPECRVPGSKLYTLARLAAVKGALKAQRVIRVLSVGSSSAGLGATASYPVRLENALERALPNIDVQVEARTLSGEVASGSGEHLRAMVAEVEPDLVAWQVGTNDALARADPEDFGSALAETVQWIKSHDIDVVLIDPLFSPSVAGDASYSDLVRKVQEVATKEGVPLVRRYEAMRYLSAGAEREGEAHMLGRHFRLNDLGLRCMAEHVTRAITLSLLQPDAVAPEAGTPKAGAPEPAAPKADAAPEGGSTGGP